MRRTHSILLLCWLFLRLAKPLSGQEPIVEWNYNGKAKAHGSGCLPGSFQIIPAGEEMSVIFSELGVDLQGRGGPKKQTKTCKLMIPLKITKGYALKKLPQTLIYGYIREEGTSGEVSVESRYHNIHAGRSLQPVPTPGWDSLSAPFVGFSFEKDFSKDSDYCRRDFSKVMLHVDLSVFGQREDFEQSIVVQSDGFDTRFDARAIVEKCP
jgi:hypothetical protein